MNNIYYNKIIDLYRLAIEIQKDNYYHLIIILIFIFGVILGLNWILNIKLYKQQIKTNIDKEVENRIKLLNEQLEKTIDEKLKSKLKLIIDQILQSERNMCMIGAVIFDNNNDFGKSVYFISNIVKSLLIVNDDMKLVRHYVDMMIEYIKTEPLHSQKIVFRLDEVKKNVIEIPDVLSKERDALTVFLNTCTEVE